MAKAPQLPRKKTAKKRSKKASPKRAVKGRSKATKKSVRRSRPRRWLARLLALSFLFLLGLGLYLLYLDHTVREKFEGRRWAVPARLYGQPLEVYQGMAITAQRLTAELKRLGYRKVKRPLQPGSWSHQGDRFLLRTRGFNFWDGNEPSVTWRSLSTRGA